MPLPRPVRPTDDAGTADRGGRRADRAGDWAARDGRSQQIVIVFPIRRWSGWRADGLPRDLKIACSSAPDLNDNAIAAVKKCKFAPATKDGTPVAVEIVVEVSLGSTTTTRRPLFLASGTFCVYNRII
ncbi:MAG: hypothetical protein DMG79_07795 [Acidobacteria bacterium]|nr:MAG: hypothetical protein DMG79_07795 [Acidobacteriota bacterium]